MLVLEEAVLNEFDFVFERPFSNDGNSVPVKYVAGCERMKNEKGVRILAPESAFIFHILVANSAQVPTHSGVAGSACVPN